MTAGASQRPINARQLFWIGVLALFTAAFTISLRGAVSGDLKAVFLDPINPSASSAMIGGVDRSAK